MKRLMEHKSKNVPSKKSMFGLQKIIAANYYSH